MWWIEPAHEVVTHNRWVRGLCDTGNYALTPLEDYNLTGAGTVIGIADTGIDMNNCYFSDPSCRTPYSLDGSAINHNCRKVIQYVTFADSADDSVGHGTHVAGIAAGSSLLEYGDFLTYNGNSPDAKIAFFDIGNSSSETGLKLPDDYNKQLFSVLYSAGARVLSNSWGSSGSSYDAQAMYSDLFMWENSDALLVFSAGNSGCVTYSECKGSVGSPGVLKNGLTVGAGLNDHQSWQYYGGNAGISKVYYGPDSMAAFSSVGPTADLRLKPDVLAPGYAKKTNSNNNNNNSKSSNLKINNNYSNENHFDCLSELTHFLLLYLKFCPTIKYCYLSFIEPIIVSFFVIIIYYIINTVLS